MRIWKSEDVARMLNAELIGDSAVEVNGCVLDSREAKGGEMFFALKGDQTDGHQFVSKALKQGASTAIVEKSSLKQVEFSETQKGKALIVVDSTFDALRELAAARRIELGAKTVGITGSNGKTTTKDMIYAVLSQTFRVYKNKNNQNNELGLPLTILNAPADTEILVLEMGMRGLGEIEYLCKIAKPDVGVITNIGTTHLELLGTRERIAQAKWELIQALPAEGTAVLNAEDYWSCRKSADFQGKRLFYGLRGEFAAPDLKGDSLIPKGQLGTEFKAAWNGETIRIDLPLPGEHNVLDALAALAAGTVFGITPEEGGQGLNKLEISKMRLELRKGIFNSTIISDVYNANPDSMKASIKVLRERAGEKPALAILGEMYELGESSLTGHQEVGKEAARQGIAELITVGKLAEEISKGAEAEGFPKEKVHVCLTKDEAVKTARKILESGQEEFWVLVKGSRGMKMEEISNLLIL